ncbi:putative bifunctional diguanylate cyclase/phosphodiesterase [Paenibacillus wynnii]|uniref:putative bifunctional diguanylate cyclase/phosphodiesterase n=1 Tax=Paenibacillus wynnii TaxID=268407 RepID=UPI0027950896|nr:EAL domain-containing protein [Paenibacillus wynnii]MDQ0192459.1 diguanylate cyclase (GGDEF)-like protein [Paenibacillus wynnii]
MLQRDNSNRTKESATVGLESYEGIDLEPINKHSFKPLWGSTRIAGIYFIVGCLWILFTDKAVSTFTKNTELIAQINMIKGWFFVFMTALIIFSLILRTLKQIKRTEEKLEIAYKDLMRTYENLESAYEEITATEEELRQQYDHLSDNQRKLTENEEKMHHLAYHDLLTSLPNKLALYENASQYIRTDSSGHAALMFVDIDNFKYINDTMGHGFGDRLIIKASQRLISIVGEEGVVYRFGGDEFIILLHPLTDAASINLMASRILAGFKKAVDMDNSLLHISTSIGISVYPEHGNDIMELVKRADIAMYKAKDAGKGKYVIFDQPLNDDFSERMNIEKQLYAAMEQQEFELYYQPQVDLAQNKITGLEALLRWNSPVLGYVSPLKFIKVAEDSHIIIPLGAWVLQKACDFLKSLHGQGFTELTMSVNISMLQLLQTDFNELVVDTLKAAGLEPHYLELEITESVLVESYDYVSDKLKQLRDLNIKIALDDFGTGYSSLSYLTHLPISTLKIDKSFIDTILTGTNQSTLVQEIIMIGKRMNMCVVAEGVEKSGQLEYLQEQGCDKIQGYLFSKPLAAESIVELLMGRAEV